MNVPFLLVLFLCVKDGKEKGSEKGSAQDRRASQIFLIGRTSRAGGGEGRRRARAKRAGEKKSEFRSEPNPWTVLAISIIYSLVVVVVVSFLSIYGEGVIAGEETEFRMAKKPMGWVLLLLNF